MKKYIPQIILTAGFIPFIAPFATAVWKIYVLHEGWSLFEFVFLYSFIYWPTYILGLIAILLAIYLFRRRNNINILPKIMIILGTIPFVVPFLAALWYIFVLRENQSIFSFVHRYSLSCWPTYIIGLAVIFLGVYLNKKEEREK